VLGGCVKKSLKKIGSVAFADAFEDDEGIIHVIFYKQDQMDIKEARAYLNRAMQLADGIKKPVLFDISQIKDMSFSAGKELLSKKMVSVTLASAILTKPLSPIKRVAIPIVMKLNKQPFPIKFFTREDEAIHWLEGFMI